MKFLRNEFKSFLIILLILSIDVYSTAGKIKSIKDSALQSEYNKYNYRFQASNNQPSPSPEESNEFVFNSQIVNNKPPPNPDDFESEVFAESASSGTYYRFGLFNWFTFVSYEANQALANGHKYWLSERNVKKDHWEATFCMPQKIDIIQVIWRLPPKSFRVYFKLDLNSEFIPATDVYIKTSAVNAEGQKSTDNGNSDENAILFNKPIIARVIRIALNEPLKKHSFSIRKIRFFVKQNTVIIKNSLVGQCKDLCFYVNTDKPRENSLVEAYSCVDCISTGNNNELFVYTKNRAITHVNSKLCVGFSSAGELVLKKCCPHKPAYTVQFHSDNTLFFDGYAEDCFYIDDKKSMSANYVTDSTDIIVTSSAEDQTYKKENIKLDGESFWHSAPGQPKVTLQIIFGKILEKGQYQGQYEVKKLDLIKIEWVKEPKKFMIYTWKPGYSWILRQTYNNYENKVSEINLLGQEASAIMIVLEESHDYKDLGTKSAYAMKDLYIGYRALKLKTIKCNAKTTKYKSFDFDTQFYKSSEYSLKFQSEVKKCSQTFEKTINIYRQIKLFMKYTFKHKEKAVDFKKKIEEVKKSVGSSVLKNIQEFKNNKLNKINNSKFEVFLSNMPEGDQFKNKVSQKVSGRASSGTSSSPAADCLQIKRLKPNALSGFYHIQPECASKPLRVFCDFTSYASAVDIFIYNDDSDHPNPDLSYINTQDYNSIRYTCAKLGLLPIEIHNKDMASRIADVLQAVGYDLSKPLAIPLGYDYSCKSNKCNNIVSSLNDHLSKPITTFFNTENLKNSLTKPGPFYGLGFSKNKYSLISFTKDTPISAYICSTNHFKDNTSDSNIKNISCDMNIMSNSSLFRFGSNVVVNCPSGCNESVTPVFGSGLYHGASSICKAALHSNYLLPTGGKVIVKTHKAAKNYIGSNSNGIKSEDFKVNDGNNSFSITSHKTQCPIDTFADLKPEDKKINDANNSSFLEMQTGTKNVIEETVYGANSKLKNIDPNEFEALDPEDIKELGVTLKKHSDTKLNKEFDDYIKNPVSETSLRFSENENSNPVMNSLNNLMKNMTNPLETLENKIQNSANQALNKLSSFGNTNAGNIYPKGNSFNYTNKNQDIQQSFQKLNKDKLNLEKSQAKQDIEEKLNTPPGGVPSVPDSSPNGSPREPEISPEKDEIAIEDNSSCTPSTDVANSEIKTIRTSADWDWLTSIKIKCEKVKEVISLFSKNLAWAKADSEYSNETLKMEYIKLTNFKDKLDAKVNQYTDMANSRIDQTKRLRQSWGAELKKLSAQDPATVDYTKNESDIFNDIFQIWDMKCDIKSNWGIHTSGIKTRSQAFGITNAIYSSKQVSASMISYRRKEYFDFNLEVDVLMVQNGVAGVSFRVKDPFNYYAFIIDKLRGIKAIIKVENGKEIILTSVNDGGILLNDWHKIIITVKTGDITVIMYDTEQAQANTEKTLKVKDHSFVKGTAGLFVNKASGFYFDSFSITPTPCWTPWTPKQDITINISNSSYLSETFIGSFSSKFEVIESSTTIDGPSEWSLKNDYKLNLFGLEQKSIVCDSSPVRKPSIALIKDKIFSNGSIKVKFRPSRSEGVISIVFKYSNKIVNGERQENFYTLDLINSVSNGQWVLRKFLNSEPKEIKSVSTKIKNLPVIGYMPEKMNEVLIDSINDIISIKVGMSGSNLQEIMNVSDNSITSGGIGFGTCKTEALLTYFEIIPPRIKLTETDKIHILTKESNRLPMPSVVQIKASYSKITSNSSSNSSTNTSFYSSSNSSTKSSITMINSAYSTITTMISVLRSSTGTNFKAKYSSVSVSSSSSAKSSEKVISDQITGWQTCFNTRTPQDRTNLCKRMFDNDITRGKCQVDFCNTCCDKNVSSINSNSIHKCKKSCYRATAAENNNDEYVNTCINTTNPTENVYNYCINKMKDYDMNLTKFCKIDMCNLCCITMDPIKKKIYSFDNTKRCFEDCSKKFNN